MPVNFISLKDLIIHKIFDSSPKILRTLRNNKRNKVDINYIIKWLEEFDKTFQEKKLKNIFLKILEEK